MLTQQSTAAALLARYRTVRSATMSFCARLTPEDMMVQSCAEASPVKWHLAHTSWFFETFVLAEFVANYRPFHPDFRWLFNSYYKALGEMPEKKLRASFSRPPLEQILAYREHVDARLCRLLEQTPEDEVLRRVVLGLEHEQQHLELAATDIKHAFFTNPLHPAYLETAKDESQEKIAPPLEWVSFSPGYPARPGVVEIGVTPDPAAIDSFAFDNETPRHSVYLAPFRIASRPVACAEYLAFIEEEGYARPELWLSEGWDTMRAEGWQAPLYWRRDTHNKADWSVFTLRGWQPLGEISETPVCHLSFFEADAFARWSGHRLPTEFEWEFVAAQREPEILGAPSIPAASSPEWAGCNMLESGHLHPQTGSATAPTPQQLFGDVWEWTQSPYTGYPGYKPLPGALGEYNGKFMSSQMVLRGGSCVYACEPHPRHVPQLLPPRHPLAVQRASPRPRRCQLTDRIFLRDPGAFLCALCVRLCRCLFFTEDPVTTAALATVNYAVLQAALTGLTATPKSLPPWLFYDERGSELFEQITALPEYALTRTERAIFTAHADEIFRDLAAPVAIAELGAGTAAKTGILLRAAAARQDCVLYQPIDVSASALEAADATLAAIPGLRIQPHVANYITEPYIIARQPDTKILALYIGSSIGNFAPAEAIAILRTLREHLLPGDALLLGTDLAPGVQKSVAALLAAYDDAAGVTAAFNKNILTRLNRELEADFDLENFAHRARWNAAESRMEMHLESLTMQTVHIAGHAIVFTAGETIHTENSYKFSAYSLTTLLGSAGFTNSRSFHDPAETFAVTLATAV